MRVIVLLAWKDLLIEARTRELLSSMSLVAFLTVVILGLAVGAEPLAAARVTPAILWVTVAFGATLGLARSHAIDQERQALQGILLTPVGRAEIFLGKCAANFILIVALQAVVVVVTAVFIDAEAGHRAALLAPPLVLGAVGFAAVGTLLGAMTATTRLRELLLPILLLPVVLPVIIVSLTGVARVLGGAGLGVLAGPLKLLAAYDVIFVLLGAWLFEYVVGE
ncbi:MAG TPA: heme exporter protein CcmB [bacterium]|nr:heme exporter protein CcmB [bacterium]